MHWQDRVKDDFVRGVSLVWKRPAFTLFLLYCFFILLNDQFFSQKNWQLPQEKSIETYVSESPKIKPWGQQVILETRGLKDNFKIKLTLENPQSNIHIGSNLKLNTKLSYPTSYKNPGVFDYGSYLRRQGIRASVFWDKNKAPLDFKINNVQKLEKIRSHFYNPTVFLLETLKIDPPNKGIIKALLWGSEDGLDESTRKMFREMGIYHLLVISGLHFTAIAVFVFFLIRFVLGFYPRIYLLYPGKTIPILVALVVLTFYYFLCLPGASVSRAYWFSAIIFLSFLLRKKLDLLNMIFMVALLLLVYDPSLLFDLSYQFSFLAVLSLVLIYPALKRVLIKFESKNILLVILEKVLHLLLVNISIFIGLIPLSVFYFHKLQLSGFLMNLWAVPVLEFVVTPLLISAFFIAPLWQGLAKIIFWVSNQILDLFLVALKQASEILPGEYSVYPPHMPELILYYLVLIILVMKLARKTKFIYASFFTLCLIIYSSVYFINLKSHSYLKLTHLDVGQGDALFLEIPGGIKGFIDTGGSRYIDLNSRVLVPYLEHKRIEAIDFLMITHDDLDHMGAAFTLMDSISIRRIFWNGQLSEQGQMQALLEKATQKGIPTEILRAGDQRQIGVCQMDILSPEKNGVAKSDNDSSLVSYWNCPQASLLMTGDISQNVEQALIEKYGKSLKSDYLKLAHHGSKSSNSYEFLREVNPVQASVSSKRDNQYKHPNALVLERLKNLKIALWRTDTQGALELDFK